MLISAPPVPQPRSVMQGHPTLPNHHPKKDDYYADPKNEPPPLPPSHVSIYKQSYEGTYQEIVVLSVVLPWPTNDLYFNDILMIDMYMHVAWMQFFLLHFFQPPTKQPSASIKKEMGDRQSSLDEFKKIDKKDIKVGMYWKSSSMTHIPLFAFSFQARSSFYSDFL